jgi:hypothetical protein
MSDDPKRDELLAASLRASVELEDAEKAVSRLRIAEKGARIALRNYDYQQRVKDNCAAMVYGQWSSRRCARAKGYGKDGLYCKQHAKRYPAEVEA